MDSASCFAKPTQRLHASVRDGDVAHLRSLIASDRVLVHSSSPWGTPLEVAVRCDNIVAVQLLLEAGADPLHDDGDMDIYATALGLAVAKGLREISTLFREWLEPHLQAGEYQQRIEEGFYAAAAYGSAAIVHDFLTWPSFTWSQKARETAWLVAIGRWEADVVDMLYPLVQPDQATIEKALRQAVGLKPMLASEERTGVPYTPADDLKQYRVVLRLLYVGGDANMRENRDSGQPILHKAVSNVALLGGLRALLDGGADPDTRCARGRTALHILTGPVRAQGRLTRSEIHEAGIRLLLDKGASAMAADDEGETPLHWAAMNCTVDIFRLYLFSCPDRDTVLSTQNSHGETLLHYAAAGGQCDTMAFLLDSGLEPDPASHAGWTPLICALAPTSVGGRLKTQADALRAARLLLSRGATPATVTNEGWTVLHCVGSYADVDTETDAAALAGEMLAHEGFPALASPARGFDRLWLSRISRAARQDLYGEEPWGFRVGKTLARCAATETAVIKDSLTPLHWAAERGAVAVAGVLMANGADSALQDSTGSTPLRLAAKSTLLERQPEVRKAIRELLEERGACI